MNNDVDFLAFWENKETKEEAKNKLFELLLQLGKDTKKIIKIENKNESSMKQIERSLEFTMACMEVYFDYANSVIDLKMKEKDLNL